MPILEGQGRKDRIRLMHFRYLKLLYYLGPLLNKFCMKLNLSCGKCSFIHRNTVNVLSVLETLNFFSFGCFLVSKIPDSTEELDVIQTSICFSGSLVSGFWFFFFWLLIYGKKKIKSCFPDTIVPWLFNCDQQNVNKTCCFLSCFHSSISNW